MAKPTKPRATTEVCADCSAPDPSWGSINRGVLVCDECCSVHRSLGRHVSEVRSLKNGYWSPTLCTMVRQLYSSGANNIWEYALMDPSQNRHARRKPHANDVLHPNKSDFIRKKYQFLAFLNKQKDSDVCTVEDLSRQLHSSVRTNNLETCLRLLSKGADPNYFYPERGNCPMHVAAQAGQILQVELLVIYGADPGAMDKDGKTPVDYAVCDGHLDLADRLIECQYQLTDRLSSFLCNRNPDHKAGQHFLIPEIAESNLDLSELAKQARKKLQALPNVLFEELAKDVYDEVDRRQNDVGPDHRQDQSARQAVLHLPVNPEFSATRNQGRQKLARLNPREFATLIIDILNDAKRRQHGALSSPKESEKDDIYEKQSLLKRVSSSEEEPIYDVVADDDDASSIDTLSARSQQKAKQQETAKIIEEIRPASHVSLTDNESLEGSEPHDVSLSVAEYHDMQEKLQHADQSVQALTQTNYDLQQQVVFLKTQIERLQLHSTVLPEDGECHDAPSPLHNGYGTDRARHESRSGHQRTFHAGVRPVSMFEPRTQIARHSHQDSEQMSTASSVMNVATTIHETPPDLPLTKPPSLRDMGDTWVSNYDNSNPSLSNSLEERTMREFDDRGSGDIVTDERPCNHSGQLPTQDDITIITEKVSKKIRELMQMAQDKRPASFINCANSICDAVQEMLYLFPRRLERADIRTSLDVLMTNALELQSECRLCASDDIAYEDLQFRTKRVIQYAYDVAMAAREVVSQLPER